MIYVVKYNGLFQHREETWFPTQDRAEEHIADILTRIPVSDKFQLTIEERKGLTINNVTDNQLVLL